MVSIHEIAEVRIIWIGSHHQCDQVDNAKAWRMKMLWAYGYTLKDIANLEVETSSPEAQGMDLTTSLFSPIELTFQETLRNLPPVTVTTHISAFEENVTITFVPSEVQVTARSSTKSLDTTVTL